MAKSKKKRSPVVPVLVAALTCDVACADKHTNKKSLIGVFDRMFAKDFPTGRFFAVYLKIADAVGHYDFEVKWVREETGDVLGGARFEAEMKDRLVTTDLFFDAPKPWTFLQPGRYSMQVYANDAYMGSARIEAVKR